ncbi:MAG: hypothetical protein ACK5B9_08725, partial [Flavobacteriia bacterium]
LYEDGTWKYEDGSVLETSEIEKNTFEFKKSSLATFNMPSKKNDFCVWYNPKKWKINTKKVSEASEFEFINSENEVYAMIINETIPIDLKNLRKAVLSNLKKEASELTIIKEEYRNVNKNEILFVELKATVSGIKFHYLYYLISNENGCGQVILGTYENLYAKYKSEMDLFLNGIDIKKKQ